MTPILEIKNLKKSFGGVQAINNLDLSFREGELLSIVGPNGSGKTTLVNVLSGMHKASGGTIAVLGHSFQAMRAEDLPRLGITRTFQDVRIFEQMSVLDNILVVLTVRGPWRALFELESTAHSKLAEAALRQVGLWEKRAERACNLSYGQRKLLEIGRVIAMDAHIILFDEPFAGLFKEMIRTVVGIINTMKAAGKTVVLIEHNMDLIRELSDRVIVMDAGGLLAEGVPHEVLARRDVIEAYLGE
jgi:ABC-type branched-subunit amino acid transport system ATPase component